MTDELLGELAARMKLIADALPQHKLSALQALGLAHECIRQMEWARQNCVKGHTLIETEESGAIFATKLDRPLTVAPEDYRP